MDTPITVAIPVTATLSVKEVVVRFSNCIANAELATYPPVKAPAHAPKSLGPSNHHFLNAVERAKKAAILFVCVVQPRQKRKNASVGSIAHWQRQKVCAGNGNDGNGNDGNGTGGAGNGDQAIAEMLIVCRLCVDCVSIVCCLAKQYACLLFILTGVSGFATGETCRRSFKLCKRLSI